MGRRNRKSSAAASGSSAKAKLDYKPDDKPVSGWEAAKHAGNVMYGQSQFDKALEHYTLAISLLDTDTSNEGLCLFYSTRSK